MGILGSLRNIMDGRTEDSSIWNKPETDDGLAHAFENSRKPQVIYKHSYSCAVSMMAKSSIESGLDSLKSKADFYLIDVKAQRKLSNKIAEITGIRHESPQIIVLSKGDPFWSDSHGGVRISKLREVLGDIDTPPPDVSGVQA